MSSFNIFDKYNPLNLDNISMNNNPYYLDNIILRRPKETNEDYKIRVERSKNPSMMKASNNIYTDDSLELQEEETPSAITPYYKSEEEKRLAENPIEKFLDTPWKRYLEESKVLDAQMKPLLFDEEERIKEEKRIQEDYKKLYDSFYTDFLKLMDLLTSKGHYSDSLKLELENYKNLVKKQLIERGLIDSSQASQIDDFWSTATDDDKLVNIMDAIADLHLNDNTKEAFFSLDSDKLFQMLSSILKASPFYRSSTDLLREDIKKDWEGFDNFWKESTNLIPNKLVKGIGDMIGSAISSVGQWALGYFGKAALKEKDDEFINQQATKFENALAKPYLEEMTSSEENRQQALKEFEEISTKASNKYRANKDTYLTLAKEGEKEQDEQSRLEEYARYKAKLDIYGQYAADKGTLDYWSNYVEDKLRFTDYLLNTGALAGTTFAADIIGAGALAYNLIPMIEEGEGYSDALVKHNPLMDYANALQETNCFDPDEQQKWKDLHLSKYTNYRTVDEENSFLSYKDIFDGVGQNGFTAASGVLSCGGSAITLKVINLAAKTASMENKLGKAARAARIAMMGPSKLTSEYKQGLREALKEGFREWSTDKEKLAAREAIAALKNLDTHKGNVAVGALIGTSEGGLEAESTYNTSVLDYKEDVDNKLKTQKEAIENASYDLLSDVLKGLGVLPEITSKSKEGVMHSSYSKPLLDMAKDYLRLRLEEKQLLGYNKAEEDATDAAYANFLANSAINGIIGVTLKSHFQSKDVRNSLKFMKGEKSLDDLVDVTNIDGKIVAKAKQGSSKWGKGLKGFKEGAKTIAGETLEEWEQSVSDEASRKAFESDMQSYIDTVLDPITTAAYSLDIVDVIGNGLEAIGTAATSKEALLSAWMGMLSTGIGGASPIRFIEGLRHKREDESYLGYTAKMLGNLYDGAGRAAYEGAKEELREAERWADVINEWANNDTNLQLLTTMGASLGFSKKANNSLDDNNGTEARDNRYNAAIQNALMLDLLKDTEAGQAYQLKIEELKTLADEALTDDFDEQGNYVGDLDWIKKQIVSARNAKGEVSRAENLSDKEIVENIGKNATEFIDLQSQVKDAQNHIRRIFGMNQAMDPVVESTYISALLTSKKAKERAASLSERLNNATKGLLSEKSDLSSTAINTLILYGSLDNLVKKYNDLHTKLNEITGELSLERSKETKLSDEKKQLLKEQRKQINAEMSLLKRIIGTVEQELNTETTVTKEDGTTETVKGEDKIFTAADIKNMSPAQIATVLNNKKKYSTLQQAEIDKFLDTVRENLSSEDNTPEMSDKDVAQEYLDLDSLTHKSKTYEKYLNEFLRNPLILTARVNLARQEARKQSLRYKYRKELDLKPNETTLDLFNRVEAKVQALKDEGYMEDALILEQLKNEHPEMLKVQKRKQQLEMAALKAIRDNLNLLLTDTEESTKFRRGKAAITTMMEAGDLDLKAIKDLFDNNDVDTIRDLLSAKFYDSIRLLNNNFAREGLKLIFNNKEEDNPDAYNNELDKLIQETKEVLDDYFVPSKSSASLDNNANIATPKDSAPKDNKQLKSSAPEEPQGIEPSELKIITPGELEPRDTEGEDTSKDNPLVLFLNAKGASEYLAKLDAKKGIVKSVNFIVTKEYDSTTPVIFAVVPVVPGNQAVKKNQEAAKNLIKIDNKYYQIVGIIKNDSSTKLGQIALNQWNTLGNGESLILKDNNAIISSETTHRSSGVSTNEVSDINTPSLLSEIESKVNRKENLSDELKEQELEAEIDDFVDKIIENAEKGKDEGLILIGTKEVRYEGDIDEFPISYEDSETHQIVTTSLREFLLNDMPKEDKIRILEESNEFFKSYFDAWDSFNISELTDRNAYLQLIGNYIFLGYPNEGNKSNQLDPKVEGKNLTIQSRKSSTNLRGESISERREFALPVLGATAENSAKELALNALTSIVESKYINEKGERVKNNDDFSYYNIQLPIKWLASLHKNSNIPGNAENLERMKLALRGLIKAGVIKYEMPDAYKVSWSISNPFKKSLNRSSLTTNPNIGNNEGAPRDPGQRNNESPENNRKNFEENQESIDSDLDEEAIKITQALIKDSELIILDPNDEKHYILASEANIPTENRTVTYERVTSLKAANLKKGDEDLDSNNGSLDSESNVAKISTTFGNVFDDIGRFTIKAINKRINSKQWNFNPNSSGETNEVDKIVNEIYDELIKDNDNNFPPSMGSTFNTKTAIRIFVTLQLTHPTWRFLSDEIKAFGSLPIVDGGQLVGEMNVAGTLDIIAYDTVNKEHIIIDMKTFLYLGDAETALDYRKEGWQFLTNSYRLLLTQRHPEIKINRLYILPMPLLYAKVAETVPLKQSEDRRTVYEETTELLYTIDSIGKIEDKDNLLDGGLFELEVQSEGVSLDLKKLSDEQKQRAKMYTSPIEPVSTPILTPIETTEAPEIPETPIPSEEEKSKKEKPSIKGVDAEDLFNGLFDDDPFDESKRTVKKAKFVEFINNHIAPVTSLKVNLISKIKTRIKEYFKDKDVINSILISDLANTFCEGNVHKLETIIGNLPITLENLPKIVEKLTLYLLFYPKLYSREILNIILRNTYYKILHKAFTEEWTEEAIIEELEKNNINISKAKEVVYYLNAEDKQAYAKELLNKIEQGKLHLLTTLNELLKSLSDTMEQISAKLEFLNSKDAIMLLNRRVDSVKQAFLNGEVVLNKDIKVNTVNNLMQKKEGTYDAMKVLSDISLKSKVPAFKSLAARLRKEIKTRGLDITLSVNPQQLNLIEGTTKGRNITIYANSLDSYEHFERVLLHEMLHAVIDLSPDMQMQMESLYLKCLLRYLSLTLIPIKDIKQDIYGFSNVNEFITEFFTNYSFNLLLTELTSDMHSNMADEFIYNIKRMFTGNKSLYDEVSTTMNSLLLEVNKQNTSRKTEKQEIIKSIKHQYDNQTPKVKEYLHLRGISKKDFNALPSMFQKVLIDCCL